MPAAPTRALLQIHKFGGASLADAAAVRHAAALIAAQQGRRLIVASAMGGVTDALMEGSRRAGDGDAGALHETARLTVTGNGMLGVPGVAARTVAALHRERVSVSLISQASSEHSICFSVPEASAEAARQALLAAFAEEIAHRDIDGVELRSGLSTLAVVAVT